MKSNRWWISGAKLRTIKKRSPGGVYHDGTFFSWKEWEKQLNLAKSLSVGDLIFNPYLGYHTKVKKVVFRSSKFNPWAYPNLRGSFIDFFYILDEEDYLIYEIYEI